MSKENIIELERKFLVDQLPKDLENRDRYDIKQYYIKLQWTTVRIRNIDDQDFILTKKNPHNEVLGTIEFERSITHIEYLKLVDMKIRGKCVPIHKIRYEKKFDDGHIWCYDVFMWDLHGIIFAEVEFDNLLPYMDFVIPQGRREITGLVTNRKLYLHGGKAMTDINDKKVEHAKIVKKIQNYLQKHKNALLKLYKTIG